MKINLKNIFISVLTFVITSSLIGLLNIYALENLILDETFVSGDYEYNVQYTKNMGYVKMTNLKTKEINIMTYYEDSHILDIDGDKSIIKTELQLPLEGDISPFHYVHGPFKASFDIHFKSMGLIAGTILAIASVGVAVSTAGVSVAVFKTAAEELAKAFGYGDLAQYVYPNASVNGNFQYKQETTTNGKQSRNLERKLFLRFGYKASYKTYNFGNGSWFWNSKPNQ